MARASLGQSRKVMPSQLSSGREIAQIAVTSRSGATSTDTTSSSILPSHDARHVYCRHLWLPVPQRDVRISSSGEKIATPVVTAAWGVRLSRRHQLKLAALRVPAQARKLEPDTMPRRPCNGGRATLRSDGSSCGGGSLPRHVCGSKPQEMVRRVPRHRRVGFSPGGCGARWGSRQELRRRCEESGKLSEHARQNGLRGASSPSCPCFVSGCRRLIPRLLVRLDLSRRAAHGKGHARGSQCMVAETAAWRAL